jgi:hypothetical protein
LTGDDKPLSRDGASWIWDFNGVETMTLERADVVTACMLFSSLQLSDVNEMRVQHGNVDAAFGS